MQVCLFVCFILKDQLIMHHYLTQYGVHVRYMYTFIMCIILSNQFYHLQAQKTQICLIP